MKFEISHGEVSHMVAGSCTVKRGALENKEVAEKANNHILDLASIWNNEEKKKREQKALAEPHGGSEACIRWLRI